MHRHATLDRYHSPPKPAHPVAQASTFLRNSRLQYARGLRNLCCEQRILLHNAAAYGEVVSPSNGMGSFGRFPLIVNVVDYGSRSVPLHEFPRHFA